MASRPQINLVYPEIDSQVDELLISIGLPMI
jgi:hypothetical protein